MPEYGRSVQMMVDMAVAIPNRAERKRCASTIVKIMADIVPVTGNKAEGQRRLWNHLARIARYKLDIDYPVDIVTKDVQAHPAPLPYPMKNIRRRHYGYLVEQTLEFAKSIPDENQRRDITERVANQMKQDLFVWNRDSMDDELVAQDIARLSEGMLQLDLDDFSFDPVGESILLHGEGGKKRKKRK